MPIEFAGDTPIYLQLVRMIRQAIAAGELPPGSKIASVRDLAIEYGVNPNTVQRSLAELERDGLVFAERTAGRYITTDTGRIEAVRAELSGRRISEFAQQMKALGYSCEQLKKALEEKWSDLDGDN